jgi:Ca2+-binding EF-hand superfamily protein
MLPTSVTHETKQEKTSPVKVYSLDIKDRAF